MESIQAKSSEGWWLTRVVAQARSHIYGWRRRAATLGIGLLAVVMAYGVVFGHTGLIAFVQKRTESRQLQAQKAEVERENERLKEHADRLENDPSAMTATAVMTQRVTAPMGILQT